jgi:hypothetical protein
VTAKQQSAFENVSISAAIAVTYLLPNFEACSYDGLCGVFILFAFPGMILSALASNIHDPNPWLVVLFNWIIYFFVLMGLKKLIRKFRGN